MSGKLSPGALISTAVWLSDSGRLHSRNAGAIHQTQLNKSNWTQNIWDMDVRPLWN